MAMPDSSPAVVGGKTAAAAAATTPVREGLVSKIASRFQTSNGELVYRKPEQLSLMTKPNRISNLTSPTRKRSLVEQEEDKAAAGKRPVSRTESHHARFNNARAMFEKMGSAEELDSVTPPPPPAAAVATTATIIASSRASSVGSRTPTVSVTATTTTTAGSVNGERLSRSSNDDSESSFRQSAAFFRSRSTSPSATPAGGVRSPRTPKTSLNSASSPALASSAVLSHSSSFQNGIAEATTGLVKSRRLSFQQKGDAAVEPSPKVSDVNKIGDTSSSSNKPNVKEMTNKQRNWFPNFERGSATKPAPAAESASTEITSVESARRESVKNDSVPQTVAAASPIGAAASAGGEPGDRRPLLGARNSSDSIEDYLRNWKKTGPEEPANDESW
jgi:hypothetical protein